jgi:hypothetical protein
LSAGNRDSAFVLYGEGELTSSADEIEEVIFGWTSFLGTGLFLGIVVGTIFTIHLLYRVPYEMLYPIGLIVGAILSHDTVAVIEKWWIVAAIGLIAALYLYRIMFASQSDSE